MTYTIARKMQILANTVELFVDIIRQKLDIRSLNQFCRAMLYFRPNLDRKGRLIRAVGALTLAAGATLAWPQSRAVSLLLGVPAAFVVFEAARGWCVLRACGVKTKF